MKEILRLEKERNKKKHPGKFMRKKKGRKNKPRKEIKITMG